MGLCAECGEEIEEGEFCYYLIERTFCQDCVEKAAMIAGAKPVRRGGFWVRSVRKVGRYLEREMDFWK